MIQLIEAKTPRLRFEKSQADQYFIYDGDTEVGVCYCRNYHSSPKSRVWTVNVEVDTFSEDDTASSIADAKKLAQELYAKVLDRQDRWNKSMENE